MQKSRQFPIVIVGGGPAGLCAGIAAARRGVRTLVLEEDPVPGGCISDCFVTMLCGGPVTGIVAELERRCVADGALPGGTKWFPPAVWTRAMWELAETVPALELRCGARVRGVRRDGGRVAAALVERAGGAVEEIAGDCFIDATGSGVFSEWCGAEVMYGRDARSRFGEAQAPETADDRVQHLTWMYISQRLPGFPPFDLSRLEHAARGILPPGMTWFHRRPEAALAADDGIYLHWGCATPCRDTRDPVELARAQRQALREMDGDLRLLREHGYAVYLAPRIGVRECRRIRGETVMTASDIRSGHYPEDTVACGDYGLDVWGESVAAQPVTGYGIPYRALLARGLDNLLTAGRIISCSHLAMSACRVIPIAGSIGQAAGTAAALAAESGTPLRAVAIDTLRRSLREQRMVLEVPPRDGGKAART